MRSTDSAFPPVVPPGQQPRPVRALRRLLAVILTLSTLLGAEVLFPPSAPLLSGLGPTVVQAVPATTEVTLGARASSDHFVVLAQHQKIADAGLAMAERAWTLLLPHFPTHPQGQVTIVIVESAAEYEAIQPAPMTRGFATFGGTRIFLRGDSVDQEVVTHELTHILFGLNARPGLTIPDWFNEGLAQYTSGAPEATMQLIYDNSTDRLLPLQQLGAVDALQSPNRDLATTEGLAVVRFLVDQYGDARLWTLVGHLRTSRTFGQALLDTYGRTDLQLSDAWMTYAQRHYNLLSPLLLEVLVTLLITMLVVAAAVILFIRRIRSPATAGGPDLTESERQAAHQAELELLRAGERAWRDSTLPPPGGSQLQPPDDSQLRAPLDRSSAPPEIDTRDQAP